VSYIFIDLFGGWIKNCHLITTIEDIEAIIEKLSDSIKVFESQVL
jgi:hypothetical protein